MFQVPKNNIYKPQKNNFILTVNNDLSILHFEYLLCYRYKN